MFDLQDDPKFQKFQIYLPDESLVANHTQDPLHTEVVGTQVVLVTIDTTRQLVDVVCPQEYGVDDGASQTQLLLLQPDV